jgi:hypothetical protein
MAIKVAGWHRRWCLVWRAKRQTFQLVDFERDLWIIMDQPASQGF